MNARLALGASVMMMVVGAPSAGLAFEKDVIQTSGGELELGLVGHGSLVFTFAGKTFYVDPFGKLTDYTKLPKADVVLVTHDHGDHLDLQALTAVRTASTAVVVAPVCQGKVDGAVVLKNGDETQLAGVRIAAVPAYNLVHLRADGTPFHPKGAGNGYVLTFGTTRVYVAGDTENTPEMKALTGIDVAFLPMNLPYTMTPEMVADAVRAFRPRVLYPYHFGDTDPQALVKLLAKEPGIEVRVRPMK